MRRLLILGALLALIATPAVATHVVEPTAPITSMDLRVLHYATKTPAPCNGEAFGFSALRLEMYVTSAAKPSEHFDAQIQVVRNVYGPQGGLQGIERIWSLAWEHSNNPPHSLTPWKITGTNSNTWLREPGEYYVRGVLDALESGQHFEETCTFTITPDAVE